MNGFKETFVRKNSNTDKPLAIPYRSKRKSVLGKLSVLPTLGRVSLSLFWQLSSRRFCAISIIFFFIFTYVFQDLIRFLE